MITAFTAASRTDKPKFRTVTVSPVASPTPSPTEISSAKTKLCQDWDTAAVAMTAASNAVADTPVGWDNPVRKHARDAESQVLLAQTAYLRSRVDSVAPLKLRQLVEEYNTLTIAKQDAAVHHDGKLVDSLIDQQNALVTKLDALCGN
ncbi:hypothetical protein [Mycobacteroides abscessus]|uniref:hypothetical protein n=1 Tax=Mycobacteroides abscessus TaxID=36809 RepID=UPI000A6FECC5|nr:hypothetical protein [Mycobacteroides abscessus]